MVDAYFIRFYARCSVNEIANLLPAVKIELPEVPEGPEMMCRSRCSSLTNACKTSTSVLRKNEVEVV
jgi:hypothetical protein